MHFGPARNLLDFHQQAGRAGRDGNPSDIIVLFYGQQLSHCEDDVRSFLKPTACYHVASHSSFDPDIAPLLPSHENPAQCRHVSDEVRALLKGALSELESSMSQGYGRSAFGSASSHGFLKELISDVVAHCHKLFSVEDIIVNVPVFSRRHAVATLGILNEVFGDVTENNFLGFTDANNDYVNSEFDNLLERCYQDFVEDFIRPLFNLY